MVQQAFSYIEKISNLDVKLKLIDTLRTVTAGKVSVQTISINIFVIVLDNKFQFFLFIHYQELQEISDFEQWHCSISSIAGMNELDTKATVISCSRHSGHMLAD